MGKRNDNKFAIGGITHSSQLRNCRVCRAHTAAAWGLRDPHKYFHYFFKNGYTQLSSSTTKFLCMYLTLKTNRPRLLTCLDVRVF